MPVSRHGKRSIVSDSISPSRCYGLRVSTRFFTPFSTPVGRCAVVFGSSGIAGIQLPEKNDRALLQSLKVRFPDAVDGPPNTEARKAIAWIEQLLSGQPTTVNQVRLDFDGIGAFQRRVYEAARRIRPGETATYGQVAQLLGSPGSARAVGQALGKNPFAIIVPCHRVLAAGGRIGGFTAQGGVETKRRLLDLEAAQKTVQDDVRKRKRIEKALHEKDPALAYVIQRAGPLALQLSPTSSTFLALAEAITHQQLTGKAAQTIFGRLHALLSKSKSGFSARAVARCSDEKLRMVGLSRAKVLALRDLAAHDLRGEIPTLDQLASMDDELVVQQLTRVRGIGRWTVEMLLIFRLGRPDVLPLDDYGVRKGFARMMGTEELPSKRTLQEHGERWSPHRSAASWYLWRAAEWPNTPRSEIAPARRARAITSLT